MITIPAWMADLGLALNRLHYKQRLESCYLRGNDIPSWFDHRIDLYYQWPNNLFWLERGFFARRHMFQGCSVLDLFCGDGFYARHFYASIAGRIEAVDKDARAIDHARSVHSHPKITYWHQDAIKEGFPHDSYDVVTWFEGIEHLSETDAMMLLERIRKALPSDGVLVGSTPLVPEAEKSKGNWEHQNEFTSTAGLEALLRRYFANVTTEVTVYPEMRSGSRSTAYFCAKNVHK
jgi:2-polyprenyl-3-methyl-5-hydroxy-6-metoxy-1,4-benzoquinol methylase